MFNILKFLLAPVRLIFRFIIMIYDRLFAPQPLVRESARQVVVDGETSGLVLYHMEACPFCVKVRRHIKRLGLNIEMRDVRKEKKYDKELVQGGGDFQVPCLRIQQTDGTFQWMYESSDINQYLDSRFST